MVMTWPIMTNIDEDDLIMDMKMLTGADAAGCRCICRSRGSGNSGGRGRCRGIYANVKGNDR